MGALWYGDAPPGAPSPRAVRHRHCCPSRARRAARATARALARAAAVLLRPAHVLYTRLEVTAWPR